MTRQQLRPSIEGLETKALLSHFGAGVAMQHARIAREAGNRLVESELAMSLTTNQSSYTVGQVVQMTMTATNRTHHDVKIWVGPGLNAFVITQNGQAIWRSNSGPQPLYPTVRRVLLPGQSLTLTANWTATATGTFGVHNQMAPQGPVAKFSVTATNPMGPPIVGPPVGSGLAISLTTNQSSYAVGQAVQMTMTATDDTNHNVAVWVGPETNVFFITQNGQTIWQSNSGPEPLVPTVERVLDPGQSLTLTASWTATASGTFAAHNELAAQGPVAKFSVTASQPTGSGGTTTNPPVPPVGSGLAISLTTNQSTYVVGQAVQMTLTATDDTNHNVTVWVGPDTNVFFITRNGHSIWQSNSGPAPLNPTVEQVLVPGQSLILNCAGRRRPPGRSSCTTRWPPKVPWPGLVSWRARQ